MCVCVCVCVCVCLCDARTQKFSSGGVQVNLTKKALTTFFFAALSLFYRSQMVNFKETIIFKGPGGGPTFSKGIHLVLGGPFAYSL